MSDTMHAVAASSPIDQLITPALNRVLAERARAIGAFGHTAESDDALGLDALGRKAVHFTQIAAERAAGPRERRHLIGAEKKAAQAAAVLIALIDSIHREMAREALGEQA